MGALDFYVLTPMAAMTNSQNTDFTYYVVTRLRPGQWDNAALTAHWDAP